MPRKVSARLAAVLAATSLVLSVLIMATPASAASLTQVTNFGDNPGNMQMYVYVPDTHTAKPPIVLAMHGCGGSGPAFYSGSEFASLADRYGFIVIYPTATQSAGFGNCFDTWSDAAKHRGGGSDPVSLISMINYVEQHYNGDAERVFATGSSSGGMMTDEMLALYLTCSRRARPSWAFRSGASPTRPTTRLDQQVHRREHDEDPAGVGRSRAAGLPGIRRAAAAPPAVARNQ